MSCWGMPSVMVTTRGIYQRKIAKIRNRLTVDGVLWGSGDS